MARKIKIYDGVKITYKGEVSRVDYISDIWDLFGWDIENDDNAKQCADAITRHLIGFGWCEIPDDNGRTISIDIIPVRDDK